MFTDETGTGAAPEWLAGIAPGTEMAERVRTFDWASTPLGHPDTWSTGLRTAVRICLSTAFPALVVWGPELTKIYNDGYVSILGREKHPAALGAGVRSVWPEIWDEIGPMFKGVIETQIPTYTEHGRLLIDRNGFDEETFFTWSYSPLYDDDGSVGGVLDIVVETTQEILAERRLAAVTALSRDLLGAETVVEACLAATRCLGRWSDDIRAADVYLEVGGELPLVATNRRNQAAPVAAELLHEVMASGTPVWIGRRVEGGPVDHVALPLGGGVGGVRGVVVASLRPELPFDEGFGQFLGLVSTTLGSALDNAARRGLELGAHRLINETLQAAMITPITDTGTVAARYVAATGNLSVGGDWYDLVELDDHRRALIVGDCVGHGLDAATAMSQLRSAARSMVLEGRDPASVLDGLDRFAESVEGAACATVVCAIIDRAAGVITYSRAGHPPPLLSGPSGQRWLDGGLAVPLAVRPGGRTNATASMDHDDVLVLYSDGLVERRGEVLDVGLDRLADTVARHRADTVAELADSLLGEMLVDGGDDDVVVVVKRLQ